MDFSCEDGFFRKVSLTGTKPSINVGLEIDSERAKLAKNVGIYSKVLIYNGKKYHRMMKLLISFFLIQCWNMLII